MPLFVPPFSLAIFAVSGYHQCSAMHRQEKAPGEVKRKIFVGIIKICYVYLVRFADKRRNSEPHGEVSYLENQPLFMFKTPCGDMKTRNALTKSIPPGSFRMGLQSATIQPSVNTQYQPNPILIQKRGVSWGRKRRVFVWN